MRSEGDQAILLDILRHIDLAQRFARDDTAETFQTDELHLYAVTRCLEVISEASRRLSAELKARHPAIGWKEMAGAGNVYRHGYQDVAALRIWDTVQIALPPLRDVVEQELKGEALSAAWGAALSAGAMLLRRRAMRRRGCRGGIALLLLAPRLRAPSHA